MIRSCYVSCEVHDITFVEQRKQSLVATMIQGMNSAALMARLHCSSFLVTWDTVEIGNSCDLILASDSSWTNGKEY